MNIHQINNSLHQDFLKEERKDPITGDMIKSGDRIVFCQVCKSAFLKDSWKYMNNRHCGQSDTLSEFPIATNLFFNVSVIQPQFITSTASYSPFNQWENFFSEFEPEMREKKIKIHLEESFRPLTSGYRIFLNQALPSYEKELEDYQYRYERPLTLANPHSLYDYKRESFSESLLFNGILAIPLIFTLIPIIAFFPDSYLDKSFFSFVGVIWIFPTLQIIYHQIKNSIRKRKIKKETHFINSSPPSYPLTRKKENDMFRIVRAYQSSITFGIYESSLFLYFDKEQKSIFFTLEGLESIEIEYQSKLYLHLILNKLENTEKKVRVPLIFLNETEINFFLTELAKAKKQTKNNIRLKLNFPSNRISDLDRKLVLSDEFEFTNAPKLDKLETELSSPLTNLIELTSKKIKKKKR
ncbi:hypothetical protein V9L05_21145 [Bernardetia sp. Wsw4-3y2]|uniref:hypothetical protein n=1 Tax=Bernardetia sp. Wsw4-3y2 TaxID=3127471 RepID=UPI0030D5397F